MDFLDPRRRRKHRKRLMIGYAILALLLIGGTVILVLATSGYSINPRTGRIVQNGLLFVDSKPGNAQIILNNKQDYGKTAARLVLPADSYNLKLQLSGYHPWQRHFKLKEQEVLRLNYSLLVPLKPTIKAQKIYTAWPLFSQTPDRRHLLVGGSFNASGKALIDDYDTNKPSAKPRAISLPSSLFTQPTQGGRLSAVEWANDNRHLLLVRNYGNANEFIMLDRQSPAQSLNLNKKLGLMPSSVSLRDHNASQLYILSGSEHFLRLALTSPLSVAKPILRGVRDYKSLGSGLILYSQKTGNKVKVSIWQNGHSYRLASLPHTSRALLGLTNFQDHQYFAVGSAGGQWVNIYRDPLFDLTKPSPGKLDAHTSLKIKNVNRLMSSTDQRLVEADNGRDFGLLDLETDKNYSYSFNHPVTPQWADTRHFLTIYNGQLTLIDYDGANRYDLAGTASNGFLSADQKQIWYFGSAKAGQLNSLSLVASQNR